MDSSGQLREFLMSRRARLTPASAGLVPFGGRRRVLGLRREEVAFLAGVSVDYYTRLERGRSQGVSGEVVDAVAQALQMSAVEHEHFRNLVAGARPLPARRQERPRPKKIPRELMTVLESITVPAFIQSDRLDLLEANGIGRALYSIPAVARSPLLNLASFFFLDNASDEFFRDRDRVARNTVAMLRAAVGRTPDDDKLVNLVGLLSTQSADFRQLWASHDVLRYQAGVKQFRHALVGDLDFDYQTFTLAAHPDLSMIVYTARPGSNTDDALQILANWTAPSPAIPGEALKRLKD